MLIQLVMYTVNLIPELCKLNLPSRKKSITISRYFIKDSRTLKSHQAPKKQKKGEQKYPKEMKQTQEKESELLQ